MVRKNIDGLTTKKRHEKVLERSDGICEVCRGNNMVQHHHIIGGQGKRTQCESVFSLISLCYDCHHGDYGIHGKDGKTLDTKLRKELQGTYEELGLEGEELQYWLGGRFYIGVD